MAETSDNVSRQLAREGYCVVADVLGKPETVRVREALVAAASESERRGIPNFLPALDPNESNVRVFNLLDISQVFRDLIAHPTAISLVTSLLGEDFLISNFTANIAKPGSGSMQVHSDQAIVIPEPWTAPWAINIIWCLDDVDEDNGATRYLPRSHLITRQSELPGNIRSKMQAFEASAGSVIVMDGRLWHTSGENVTTDRERALLFGYYTRSFIRPQWNWSASLSAETQGKVSEPLYHWLGLGPVANTAALFPDIDE